MKKKPLVVIDTNIFISGLIIPQSYPYQIVRLWQDNCFNLVICQYLLEEIEDVLERKKIRQKYNLNTKSIQKIIHLLNNQAKIVKPTKSSIKVRDPKDQIILDTALAVKVDYLVTGDDDLLCLAKRSGLKNLKIIKAKKFIKEIGCE